MATFLTNPEENLPNPEADWKARAEEQTRDAWSLGKERARREMEVGFGEKRERVLGLREGRTREEAEAEADMAEEIRF